MRELKDFSQVLSELRRKSLEEAEALPEPRKILDLPPPVAPRLDDQMLDLGDLR